MVHFEYGRLFTNPVSDGSIENNPNGDFNYMKGLLVARSRSSYVL